MNACKNQLEKKHFIALKALFNETKTTKKI